MRGLLRAESRLAAVHPTSDAAGTVATRSAGLIEFSAAFSYRRAEEVPEALALPALPDTVRCSFVGTGDLEEGRREILGEIMALSETDLGIALETVLRALTITAALSNAVLQSRAARLAPVRQGPAAALQTLALDLRDAGFGVRFAPTWTPVAEGAVGLGIRGAEQELERFLEAHPTWMAI
ncbi:MAG: hypothetical protein H0V21_06635 [Rubrobacter sp.]|nr:hypothetical protein [Rubrobacter sp.]